MGRELGLGFNQNFSPLLAPRHCVTLSKFLHLPGLLFLSCKCHATFGLFAANFVGKSILGSVIIKRDSWPPSHGRDPCAQTPWSLWISLSSPGVNFLLLLASPAVTV